jgi:precorrin-2 dehydrogenase/sirohydrochlorin ferrochelatase
MDGKPWYPVFLDMEQRRAVVIGGGAVALRKVQGLLEAGARVTVVSPGFDPGFEGLTVDRAGREFAESDLDGAALVFASTNVREVNRRIGELARARGIPANIADAPAECGFIVPARIRRAGLQIAISTGGEDPARAASARKKLEELLDLMRP